MKHPPAATNPAAVRLRWAGLASGIGAGILGIGLGVLWAAHLRPYALSLLFLGVLLHGWGMLETHRTPQRKERADDPPPWWSVLLYALCWLALVLVVLWLAWKS